MNTAGLHLHSIPFTLDVLSSPPPRRAVAPVRPEEHGGVSGMYAGTTAAPGSSYPGLAVFPPQNRLPHPGGPAANLSPHQYPMYIPPTSPVFNVPTAAVVPPTQIGYGVLNIPPFAHAPGPSSHTDSHAPHNANNAVNRSKIHASVTSADNDDATTAPGGEIDLAKVHRQFPQFTMGQLKTYLDQFKHFDKDGSGEIEADELKEVMDSVGKPVNLAQAQTMIEEHDHDGDGAISFSDFLLMLDKMKNSGEDGGGFGEAINQVFEVGALLTAASKGDAFNLARALESGTSPDSADYDDRTALHLAAAEGHLEAVRALVTAGAHVNNKDRWGHTALDDAARAGHADVSSFLESVGAVFGKPEFFSRQLNNAAAKGDEEEVRRLLKTGISVNMADFDHRTALHHAAGQGQLGTCRLLLESKADVHAQDRWGGTPLSDALRSGVRTGSDAMRDLLLQYGAAPAKGKEVRKNHHLSPIFAVAQLGLILLYWFVADYSPSSSPTGPLGADGNPSGPSDVTQLYAFYQDIHVMIFIGFGYLMTFLRKYGYGSVGINYLVACFVILWYSLVNGFFSKAFTHDWSQKVPLGLPQLIVADFCAAAVLITFGGLLGKTSPTQMLVIAFFETVCYSINEQISIYLSIADIGGSMVIHTFGAIFGLVASKVLTPDEAKGRSDNAAVYRSDLFSMLGTIFLWLYWPSFNGATGLGNSRERAIVNTLLSLTGACIGAFAASHHLRRSGELSMVDIQNSTLAGGVACGSIAHMFIQPGGAITLGVITGVFSVFGYVRIQPYLEKKLGLHDTCGINNLHGMPGIISGLGSIVVAGMATPQLYGSDLSNVFPLVANGTRTSGQQAAQQAAFLAISIGIGGVGGYITARICKHRWCDPPTEFFNDASMWEVPPREMPYYFDKQGELNRDEIKDALVLIAQEKEESEMSQAQHKASAVRQRVANSVARGRE